MNSATVAFTGALSNASAAVYGLQIDGHPPRDPQDHRARADWVGPDYFRTVGIPLVAGRDFTPADTVDAQRVIIVNETMARAFFSDRGALGRRVTFNKNAYEIIGVAKDAKYTDLRAAAVRMVYFQFCRRKHLQRSGDPHVAPGPDDDRSLRSGQPFHDVDPRLRGLEGITLAERLDRKLIGEHLVADLASYFSGLTLLLASIGVYGTLAYTAARRTREIGVRLALGSGRGAVLWLMMRGLILRLGLGVMLGAIGVLAAAISWARCSSACGR